MMIFPPDEGLMLKESSMTSFPIYIYRMKMDLSLAEGSFSIHSSLGL